MKKNIIVAVLAVGALANVSAAHSKNTALSFSRV